MDSLWLDMCKELGVSDAVAGKWRERLLASYQSPERHYHNASVMFVTHKLPHLTGPSPKRDVAVALASIFQYLEFRPKTDLSQENAARFREFAEEAGLSTNQTALVSKVLRLLGAQQEAGEDDLSEDVLNYFQDLDLTVLGADEGEYSKYRQLLRKEFPDLDDAAYNKMRLHVLQPLLLIPTIYSSEAFAHLESTARANIEREIVELSQ